MPKGGHRAHAGRPRVHAQTDDYRCIDVRQFAREGMLESGRRTWCWWDADTGERMASIGVSGGPSAITFDYRYGGQMVLQRIHLQRTACTFGGARPWFLCPQCGRAVAVLYLGGLKFSCRHCLGLRYSSQAETKMDRCRRHQGKLEVKLGPYGAKPKGMHAATWMRIRKEILLCETERTALMMRQLKLMGVAAFW